MKHPTAIIFSCDLAVLPVELPHCGEHIVGSDQAWVTLRADRQDQLKKAHDAPFLLCVVLPYPR
ncbi:MAG TPA: hypothetical protein VFI43_08430 [Nitrosospira sp.]|nr:hypothetical protein [Nitrosospira sp.]